jgi:hypothetical protein
MESMGDQNGKGYLDILLKNNLAAKKILAIYFNSEDKGMDSAVYIYLDGFYLSSI